MGNGFGRIGRNVLRCWLKREEKPFDIVAINVGSMGSKTAAHLLKYDTVLGTLKMDVSCTEDSITCGDKTFKVVNGRDPAAMPWKDMDVDIIIESTGAFNSLDGGSKHLEAGAKKVVLTAPGKNCPTCAAKAEAEVLPQFKGKLNGIALRVPTPNVSVVDLVVKVSKKTSAEDVNAAIKTAADGPLKGIINFEQQPLVSSDFMQTDYSNSVDSALTMVMGEDLVKVVMWYDNEWGYSQRVIDLT